MASARNRAQAGTSVPVAFATSTVSRRFVPAESSALLPPPEVSAKAITADFDRRPIRDLLKHLAADPDAAMEYLFARLFAGHPLMRALFPHGMTQTRVAVFGELAGIIAGLDDQERTEQVLARLAVDHRKFGVRDKHYEPFFDAVFATAEHAAGPAWTREMATAWRSALDWFGSVMAAAAADDADEQPAWWTGEIVQHDRRTETVAVLTIRPDRPLSYVAGQYVQVQTLRWPRIWRSYSIANAPRANGLLDIHVRAVPGGMVSTALVSHCATGDIVLLGAARGQMRVPDDPARDLVCVAGGTGLAPLKAITEAVVGAAGQGKRRGITLYAGVRRSSDLYDLRDLETLRLAYPSLTVIPVAEHEVGFAGRVGRLPDVVWTHESFRDCDVYIAGPVGLISRTVQVLSRRVPADRVHHDPIQALRLARRPPRLDDRSRPAASPASP
ncbi:MAG TPA: globin domain-containing protein [Streptosporangiaceae bacterium]